MLTYEFIKNIADVVYGMYLGFVPLTTLSKKLFTPLLTGLIELVGVGNDMGGGAIDTLGDGLSHEIGWHGFVKVGLTIFLYSSYEVMPGAEKDD